MTQINADLYILADDLHDADSITNLLWENFEISHSLKRISAHNFVAETSYSEDSITYIAHTRKLLHYIQGFIIGALFSFLFSLAVIVISNDILTLQYKIEFNYIIILFGAVAGALYFGRTMESTINPRIKRYKKSIVNGSCLLIVTNQNINHQKKIKYTIKNLYPTSVIDIHEPLPELLSSMKNFINTSDGYNHLEVRSGNLLYLLADNKIQYENIIKTLKDKFGKNNNVTVVTANNYGLDGAQKTVYQTNDVYSYSKQIGFILLRKPTTEDLQFFHFLKGALVGAPIGIAIGFFLDPLAKIYISNYFPFPAFSCIAVAIMVGIYTGYIVDVSLLRKIRKYKKDIMSGKYLIIYDAYQMNAKDIYTHIKNHYPKITIE